MRGGAGSGCTCGREVKGWIMEGRHFNMSEEDHGRKTRPREGDPLAPGGRIGARLRALYAEIEREPIPDGLIDLLEQLDEAERRQQK